MSNFVTFVKEENILKLGITFLIATTTQNFFQSLIDKITDTLKINRLEPMVMNLLNLFIALVITYFLSKIDFL
jgi:uncharacterized protein YacL